MPYNCCVPNCFTNTKDYKLLSFHSFPKNDWKTWERLIRNDNLGTCPRVCSLHFPNGQRTYDSNTPRIFPWTTEWPVVVQDYNKRTEDWFNNCCSAGEHIYVKKPRLLRCVPLTSTAVKKRVSRTSQYGIQVLLAVCLAFHYYTYLYIN